MVEERPEAGLEQFLTAHFVESWANYRAFWDQRTGIVRYMFTAFAAFSAALPALAALLSSPREPWYENWIFWTLFVAGYWALSMLGYYGFTVTRNWSQAMHEHQTWAETIRDYFYGSDPRFAKLRVLDRPDSYIHKLPQDFGSADAIDTIVKGLVVVVLILEMIGAVIGPLSSHVYVLFALLAFPIFTVVRFWRLASRVKSLRKVQGD